MANKHKQSLFSEEVRKKKSFFSSKYKVKEKGPRRRRGRLMWQFRNRFGNSFSFYTYAVVALALFLLLIYLTLMTSTFKITRVDLFEGEVLSENLGMQQVAGKLRGKNIFLINKRSIMKKFAAANPRLKSVEIDRDFPSRLIIKLGEAPAVANLILETGNTEKSFVINEQGVIIKLNEQEPGLPTIRMASDEIPSGNQTYLDPDLLSKMSGAALLFDELLNLPVAEVRYLATAREIHIKAERGFVVWLDLEKEIRPQLQKLKDAVAKLNIYEEDFIYIDLRISGATGDRIIYKRVGAISTPPPPPPSEPEAEAITETEETVETEEIPVETGVLIQ